jgi:GNAT superfamily N-acetyltransferase
MSLTSTPESMTRGYAAVTAIPAPPTSEPPTISFRPINDADLPFLCTVYGSTREDELMLTDWDDARKATFVEMQFTAQHAYYQEHYDRADFLVVLVDNVPAGRLYVNRGKSDIRIVDIALLPDHRGHGIGGRILASLLAEARATGRTVSIHVEKFNPAMRLYHRLGFQKVEDKGVYDYLVWSG